MSPRSAGRRRKKKSDFGQVDGAEIDVFEVKDAWECPPQYRWMQRIISHVAFQIMLNALTIYTLFSDDIRVIFFRLNSDNAFDWITCISLVLFVVEIIFSCYAIEGYWKSFFMYLDIISTISLVLDIQFLFGDLFSESESVDSGAKVAQGAKAGRIGTK